MPITALPTPPSRADSANFASRADAFLAALPTFATEANAMATEVNNNALSAAADAASAAVDAASSATAAATADSAANVTKWVSGTSYSEGVVVWSPASFLSYRRKSAGAGTTDPSLDSTNWAVLTLPPPAEIVRPTAVSPTGGVTVNSPPTLTGSTYYSLYGVAMSAAQWQVSTTSTFATTVLSTGDVAGTATTYAVASGVLSVSTTYFWRVRYKDANGLYSEWSTASSFVTAATLAPNIGDAFGGGFYAGDIVQGGTTYRIVVAPKSSGENSSRQWKTTNDAGPAASQTLNNGPSASSAMNSASYPAAQWCEALTIGGFSDWYLPSRDELEVCYRNLKPTTGTNNTGSRSLSGITYPEGNDVSGDTMGRNRNSSPAGAVYTSSVPGQTSVVAFRSGGAEAFAAGYYWSSSEFSSTVAWAQSFSDGFQNFDTTKAIGYYVRAVRRLAV